MRKIYCFALIFLMLLHGINASAAAESAKSACVINAVTGEVVFEKNSDDKLPMASTTKIMTLLLAVENTELDEVVTVTHDAICEEGSSAYIEEGGKITMRDLEYGLMLNSGNDAAVAIACHISGDKKKFAELMNEKAEEIGVKNTSFKNPNGLDENGHYTTAYDLARITQYALNNEQFAEVVKTKEYTASLTRKDGSVIKLTYGNHNRLLRELENCIGVKTGFTKADGRCLVSAAQRDNMCYIAVTLNDSNDWNDHKELLEMGFSGCRIIKAVKKGDCIRHIVNGEETCRLIAAEDINVPVNSKKGSSIQIENKIPKSINMPLNKNEKIGMVSVYYKDIYVGECDVIAEKLIGSQGKSEVKRCFWLYFQILLRSIL